MNEHEQLVAHFRSMADEELLRRCSAAMLTPEAEAIARREASARGLQLPEPPPAPPPQAADADYHGDFTIVARHLEPTEAYLLKNCLGSFAIPAIVADANLAQANPFFGAAAGGASVRVPLAFAREAAEVIAKFNRGEISVEDKPSEEAPRPAAEEAPPRRLKTYRVYTRAGEPVPIVVKQGFSWAALIFGPLWFLVNRMWLNFAIVAALFIGGNLYLNFHVPAGQSDALLHLAFMVGYCAAWLLVAWFAAALYGLDLEAKGYRLAATVRAPNPAYARGAVTDAAPAAE